MTVVDYQARTLYRGHYADPVTGQWRQENQYVCRVAVDEEMAQVSWYTRERDKPIVSRSTAAFAFVDFEGRTRLLAGFPR